MAEEILTLEDCKTVLKNYLDSENFEIVSYSTKQFFDEVNGFLGEHILLQIDVIHEKNKKQLRFFMKRFPFEHDLQSGYLRAMQGWQREIYFYETFLVNLKNSFPEYDVLDVVPKYLLGKPDDIIVFEDLTLKNYDLPRQSSLNLLDNKHICLVLKALAKFHAGSLAYEEYRSHELGETFRLFTGEEDLIKEPLVRKQEGFLGYDWVKAGVKGLSVLINKVHRSDEPVEEVQAKFSVLVEKALQLMFPQNKFRNVLANGDMWAKNVMFQYEGESTVPLHALLVDFQLIRYHVPAHDVLLFLSLTTNKAARQQYFHFYMKYYHDTLVQELKQVKVEAEEISLSYEDFLRSVSFILPEIKIQGALQRLQQCGNKEFYSNLLNDKDGFRKFVFEDKTPFALDLFETDANFKGLLTEAVEEIIESSLYPEVFREDCYRILEEELGSSDYDLKEYKVEKGRGGDNLYELDIAISVSGKDKVLKYLIKSEPLDFARVIKEL